MKMLSNMNYTSSENVIEYELPSSENVIEYELPQVKMLSNMNYLK